MSRMKIVIALLILGGITYFYVSQRHDEFEEISFNRACIQKQKNRNVNFYQGKIFGFDLSPEVGEKWGDYAVKVFSHIQPLIFSRIQVVTRDEEAESETLNMTTKDGRAFTPTLRREYQKADVIVLASSVNPINEGYIPHFYWVAKHTLPFAEVEKMSSALPEHTKFWTDNTNGRDAYCGKSSGNGKTVFSIVPILDKPDDFLSGRSCLHSILLSLACVNVDFDNPAHIQHVDKVFFQEGKAGQLTEVGRSLLINRIKHSR